MRGGRGMGRGGRGGRGRGGRNGHRMGGGGHRRGRRDSRDAVSDGNERERIAIESGSMVLIDQFMLANPQFAEKLSQSVDESTEVKDNIIRDFGGCTVEIEPGTYRIERNPYAPSIIIHLSDKRPDVEALDETVTEHRGQVFVDTRCLAMIDRELLDDGALLEKYQQLWFSGQEKACRDLLRDNGGAVRYGFQRYGDELQVFLDPDDGVVCLWPRRSTQPNIASQQPTM